MLSHSRTQGNLRPAGARPEQHFQPCTPKPCPRRSASPPAILPARPGVIVPIRAELIRSGNRQMRAITVARLSDADLDAVIAYLRSIQAVR